MSVLGLYTSHSECIANKDPPPVVTTKECLLYCMARAFRANMLILLIGLGFFNKRLDVVEQVIVIKNAA